MKSFGFREGLFGIGGTGKDVIGGAAALIVPVAGAELETTILRVEATLLLGIL
ncbi:hypothetical protein BT96DRAFT_930273, partial [Gymnopus androsaceus JB14]